MLKTSVKNVVVALLPTTKIYSDHLWSNYKTEFKSIKAIHMIGYILISLPKSYIGYISFQVGTDQSLDHYLLIIFPPAL